MIAYGCRVRKKFVRLVTVLMGMTVLLAAVGACGSEPGAAITATSVTIVAPSSQPATTAAPTLTAREKTVTATTPPKPVTRSSVIRRPTAPVDPLTGQKPNAGPVIAAKIDNTSAGFPQFGVAAADIVYVEQVEGGLTRLIAVFHTRLPREVGPIRSVRSTDSELLTSYGTPGIAFSGGAGGPLAALAKTPVVDLSPDRQGSAYWRSQFGDGTHNLHVDLETLANSAASELGRPRSPGFAFTASDPRVAAAPAGRAGTVTMQAGRTGFTYSGGRYVMDHKGTAYVDHDGTAVLADNVLVQNVKDEPDGTVDSVGSPSYLSHTIGTGTFTLFRDGHRLSGTWKRSAAADPTSFLDLAGKPVPFKPGKTWVLLAPQSAQFTTG